jgi:hypothetical protein
MAEQVTVNHPIPCFQNRTNRTIEQMHSKSRNLVVIRIAVVMLLASLAGFSTLAKTTQYLPNSNPARFLSIASKMRADCTPATIEAPTLQPRSSAIAFVLPLPTVPIVLYSGPEDWDAQFIERVGITVSVRHRAPPVVLS